MDDHEKGRVLVVHADVGAARLLARELEEAGHGNVVPLDDARRALEELEAGPVSLILADAHLPGVNGFQLCRLLRSRAYRRYSKVPVVLLSASFRDPRIAALAREAGALTFLDSSRDRPRLAGIVDDVVAGRFTEPAPETSPRAMILSTDEELRRSLEALPDLEGFRVSSCSRIESAEAALVCESFDLVLVSEDVGEEAVSLVRTARRLAAGSDVLFLRTGDGLDRFTELMNGGADDYVDVPVAPGELRNAHRRARLCREIVVDTKRLESSDHRWRASEARCRRQSGLLRSLMETSGDGIVLCDDALVVTTLNPAALRIFATSRPEVVGRPIQDLLGCDSGEVLGEFLARPRGTEGESFETDRVIQDQTKALSVGINRRDEREGGPGLLLIVRDITRERELRSQLAQSQKLDSLGALAGGIAHDFNNILASILPNAELIASSASADERLCERARTIQMAARRGGELTRRLLAFARPEPRGPVSADPNGCVEATVAMLRETLGRNVTIDCQLMTDAVRVPVTPSQLEHALLNLGINARDAMPDGGTLRYRTRLVEGRAAPGAERRVVIAVEDTGLGMDERTREQVFEPFFTTKDASKGTGLGLSIVSETVRAANGTVEVTSKPGEGTRFEISLPEARSTSTLRHPAAPLAAADTPSVPVVVAGAGESVLVVDDEEPVRRLTAEMLRRLDYTPEAVSSGEAALQRCREREFDLVLLDMVMTGMDGRATFEAIRALRPKQNAMIATGDARSPRVTELSKQGVVVLEKPFSLEALASAVRGSLCATPSTPSVNESMSKGA